MDDTKVGVNEEGEEEEEEEEYDWGVMKEGGGGWFPSVDDRKGKSSIPLARCNITH